MEPIAYKDFTISPIPTARQDGTWTICASIAYDYGAGVNVTQYSSLDSYDNEDEAIRQSLEFGKRVIDGQVPDCSVERLVKP